MDGLEEKLSTFLSDPSAMEQVLTMARSLGLGAQEQAEPEQKASAPAIIDDPMTTAMIGMMQQMGREDSSQAALLNALRPFVRPERREKIDQAMQIAKLAHIAGAAMQQFGKG